MSESQMEQSISSLAFKGSIIEAITEAKRQKKLFVVYISGGNEDSVLMDKSTWTESSVAESLSKYCILLHILEGSTDATQFSALYPQKSAPCITAIGYNGVQLWQNEGFVSGEVLASTLEKTWLSLHVQETTATFLTAALASQQSEQVPLEAPRTASREKESSSSVSSTDKNVRTSGDRKDADHVIEESENCEPPVEGTNSRPGDEASHGSSTDKLEKSNIEQPDNKTGESSNQGIISSIDPGIDKKPSLNVESEHVSNHIEAPQVVDEASGLVEPEKAESSQIEEVDNSDLALKKSSDIHLNIRLPGGVSLRETFQPTSTLRMVKDYVDEKQESSIGSYDLAIPYPRKVFNDQDLSKTLSELGLPDRQALIVVPHLRTTDHSRARSSLPNQSTSVSATGTANGEGYFSYVKRVLSYVNPFYYLGGGSGAVNASTSVQDPQRSVPQPGVGSQRSYLVTPNQSSDSPSSSRNNRPRFGSNIHTLKHDEDDSNFSGKNAFWNGNSTEYGGDGDNK